VPPFNAPLTGIWKYRPRHSDRLEKIFAKLQMPARFSATVAGRASSGRRIVWALESRAVVHLNTACITGAWWIDSAGSLAIVWFLVKEGSEAWSGGCC
jgi:hypothetical protein